MVSMVLKVARRLLHVELWSPIHLMVIDSIVVIPLSIDMLIEKLPFLPITDLEFSIITSTIHSLA